MVKYFAAFIMTYERATILENSIKQILDQSRPPEKILIVDNSISLDTEQLIAQLNDVRLEYCRVGYNSGPAGAAKIGLQRLTDEGYQWIYWGDDDDPPTFHDSLEILMSNVHDASFERVGVIGAVGQYFSKLTGNMVRVPNDALLQSGFLDADSVAGGQNLIVNAAVVKKGILPTQELFFGFEELDFCLQVKKAGFDIKVSTDLFARARKKYARVNYYKPLYVEKDIKHLSRQYYSTRNMLVILKSNGLHVAFAYNLIKDLVKSVIGFWYGWSYGRKNLSLLLKAIWDGLLNNLGQLKEIKK